MHPTLSVNDILQALSVLTSAELAQVESKIQLLKADPLACNKVVGDSDEELLLRAIAEFFEGQGLENCSPAILKRAPGFATFKNKTVDVVKYFRAGYGLRGDTLTRVVQLAFFNLAVELLYKDMQNMGVAVSSRTLMNHVHRIPAVINQAFPGYAGRKLLWLVTRKR